MTDDTENALALVKELIAEMKSAMSRIEVLEAENLSLKKAVEDPQIMMQKQGWMKFVTPHADETFDPLNRDGMDVAMGPFAGSGDIISKSRFDELQDWEDAEREMRG